MPVLALALLVSHLVARGQEAVPEFPHKDFAQVIAYPVSQVIDADTVVLRVGDKPLRVALIGVAQKGESAARDAARLFAENLLDAESVYVEFASPRTEGDPAGVAPAYVYRAPDGLFVNLEIVRQGFAPVEEARPFEYVELFRFYERRAREANKGVWRSAPRAARMSEPQNEPKVGAADGAKPPAVTPVSTVYVTRTGKKYHLQGCQHLRGGAKPLPLADAKKTHTPCSRCKPP